MWTYAYSLTSEFQRSESDIYNNLLENKYFWEEPQFKSKWNIKYSQVV